MAVGKLPPQQPQQQVGGLSKNQQLGLFLSSLSDVFAGKDPSAGFIQRQQFLQQQQLEQQQQKINQDLNNLIDQSDLPETQKGFLKAMSVKDKYNALYEQKDQLTADQRNYSLARAQGYAGTFMDYLQDKKSPLVSIDQSQKVFEQEAAKAGFKTQAQAQETIESYSDIENRLDILQKQLEGTDPLQTGVLEEIKIPFKRIAAGLNILPQEELDKLGQQELFIATTGYIIPRMRVAGSGSTSDREIELFKSAVPNLGNTVEGNKVLVGGLQAIAKYNKKRLFLMDDYLREKKSLLGFGEYADKQLGSLYKSYESDQDFDSKVKKGELKAGDFVYDGVYGQFRVLTKEDIEGAL
jgi:hypothetical protein